MLAQVQAASTQTGLLSSTPQSCSSFSLKKAGLYEWQNQAQPFSVCCGRVSGYSRPWLGVDRDSSRRAGPLPPSHFTEEVKPGKKMGKSSRSERPWKLSQHFLYVTACPHKWDNDGSSPVKDLGAWTPGSLTLGCVVVQGLSRELCSHGRQGPGKGVSACPFQPLRAPWYPAQSPVQVQLGGLSCFCFPKHSLLVGLYLSPLPTDTQSPQGSIWAHLEFRPKGDLACVSSGKAQESPDLDRNHLGVGAEVAHVSTGQCSPDSGSREDSSL